MRKWCSRCFVFVALLAFPALAFADEAKPKESGKTDPAGVPLELRLVAKKASYPLDLGGKTAAEFRKELDDAQKTGRYPPPPAVDLSLELRNTGTKDLMLQVQGDANVLTLQLEGPGAMSVAPRRAFTTDFRLPKIITIAAGKSHTFPAIKSLTYGFRGVAQQSYWIKAGEYTLTASYKTAVSPAPKGAKDARNGFGHVTVTSAPVKIKVEAK
jgi:hypothetical protein